MLTRNIYCLDLGLIDYGEGLRMQEFLVQYRKHNQDKDFLVFQEFFPVITLGKSGILDHLQVTEEELKQKGITVFSVGRGGDVTYHGPGQLVVTPILAVKSYVKKIHDYVRLLEQVVINLLDRYGINGQRIEGASGVWVNNKKVAAIGIAVKHGITQHGIALNIDPDLTNFDLIVPCGIRNKGVVSLKALGVSQNNLSQVREDLKGEFAKLFDVHMQKISIDEMRCLLNDIGSTGAQIC